jgi:hypothetical protein
MFNWSETFQVQLWKISLKNKKKTVLHRTLNTTTNQCLHRRYQHARYSCRERRERMGHHSEGRVCSREHKTHRTDRHIRLGKYTSRSNWPADRQPLASQSIVSHRPGIQPLQHNNFTLGFWSKHSKVEINSLWHTYL